MTRNRASAKAAGARFEREIADYLQEHLSHYIDRAPRYGSVDKGDIANVYTVEGGRVCVEAKNVTRMALAGWYGEAVQEALNLGAVAAVVVHKRHGKGNPGEQWVTMTVADLVTLLGGAR